MENMETSDKIHHWRKKDDEPEEKNEPISIVNKIMIGSTSVKLDKWRNKEKDPEGGKKKTYSTGTDCYVGETSEKLNKWKNREQNPEADTKKAIFSCNDSGYIGGTSDRISKWRNKEDDPDADEESVSMLGFYKGATDFAQTGGLINKWKNIADEHTALQKDNPFHDYDGAHSNARARIDKNSKDYAIPKVGSETYLRGLKAGKHVSKEIINLCFIINHIGVKQPDGKVVVKFGRLFTTYTKISDTVVGMLNRARRHGVLEFEGEMLYQGQDDDVDITLLRIPEEEETNMKCCSWAQ